ncbi:MAG: hydroxymethylbilane synthase [Chloroflexi bacterium OHK40]
MARRLTLGTRGSKLALAQSEMVAARLTALHPDLEVELRVITTRGDRVLDVALSAVGDKGLFVKELEHALLANEVDLCVHSCKDLPSLLPDGLVLGAFPERADPRDVLVLPARGDQRADSRAEARAGERAPFEGALAQGAIVGTSSLRRACQLRALRPDLTLRDVRGNVDTRLRKLAEGQYDALVLAAAGLERLGLLRADGSVVSDGAAFVAHLLPAEQMLPAVAQGTLAIECRAGDAATRALLAPLDHGPTRAAALAERAFLRRLEGGCQVPIAAHASAEGASLLLRGLVGSLDGATVVRGELAGSPGEPETLGTALADELLTRGAGAILAVLATGHQALPESSAENLRASTR